MNDPISAVRFGEFQESFFDSVLILDRNYNIVFNNRYQPKFNTAFSWDKYQKYIGMNYFEAYPTLDRETSTFVECMNTGKIIMRKKQRYRDFEGTTFIANNITVPIIKSGIITGAVELSKDIKTFADIEDESEFDNFITAEVSEKPALYSFDDIITCCKEMISMKARAELFATMQGHTLICGETGTGKELFAQAMILRSQIPEDKIVIQNCAATPSNLMEAIFFGAHKGAYTGAERIIGLFEQADGGILFLDELNTIPIEIQGKLLRVLQDGSFRSIGAKKENVVSVKVICTMNIDPLEAIKQGTLRSDLFYRLTSQMITLPPLRNRKEDIQRYIDHFITQHNKTYKKSVSGVTSKVLDFFHQYNWPGNVREISNVLESMIAISTHPILDVGLMPAYLLDSASSYETLLPSNLESIQTHDLDLIPKVKKLENQLIIRALELSQGNKTQAAQYLGIPRQTLNYKIRKNEIATEIDRF